MSDLCPLLERPQLTCYEIVEEQTSDIVAALKNCRGVVVMDACLTPQTRQFVERIRGPWWPVAGVWCPGDRGGKL